MVGDARSGARDKHQLYVQSRHLTAPATDGRLLRSIVRAGASLVAAPGPDLLVVQAIPVVRPDGSAALVDTGLNHELRLVQPRLDRAGYRVLDCPTVAVDPTTSRVRIPDAAATWGIDRAHFDAELPARPGDDHLGAVDAVVTRVVVATSAVPESHASAVAAAAGLVRRNGRLETLDVDRLARVLTPSSLAAYVTADPAPLTDLIG